MPRHVREDSVLRKVGRILQAPQRRSIMLARTSLRMRYPRTDQSTLFPRRLARNATGLALAIERLRHWRRAALGGQTEHVQLHPLVAAAYRDPIAHVHRTGGLARRSVQFDLATADRLLGQAARLEEARGPEPYIDTNAGRGCGFRITHGVIMVRDTGRRKSNRMDPPLSPWLVGLVCFVAGFLLARSIYRRPATPPPRVYREIDDAQIDTEIRAGRTIDAIKLYRERYRCGLKEAKAAVDHRASELDGRR